MCIKILPQFFGLSFHKKEVYMSSGIGLIFYFNWIYYEICYYGSFFPELYVAGGTHTYSAGGVSIIGV
jgi:hypothetical protein